MKALLLVFLLSGCAMDLQTRQQVADQDYRDWCRSQKEEWQQHIMCMGE